MQQSQLTSLHGGSEGSAGPNNTANRAGGTSRGARLTCLLGAGVAPPRHRGAVPQALSGEHPSPTHTDALLSPSPTARGLPLDIDTRGPIRASLTPTHVRRDRLRPLR